MTDLHKMAEFSHAKSDAWRKCAGQPTYMELVELLQTRKHFLSGIYLREVEQALSNLKGDTND